MTWNACFGLKSSAQVKFYPSPENSPIMNIKVEFAGGLELLFDKVKFLDVKLEAGDKNWTISGLIRHLSERYVKERVELFSAGDKIRPGILILVNDVDFEILGGYEYNLKPEDKVLFISTLHGG